MIFHRTTKRCAAACAALLATTCTLAQTAPTQVTLSGVIDSYAGREQLAGRSANHVVNPSGLTTSYWGLQVSEALGDGLRAQASLFSFFTADTGGAGRYPGDAMFSRRATVGLAGGFGEVNLGRMNSPFFFTMVAFDPFAGGSLGPIFQHTYPGGQPLVAPMLVPDSGFLNMLNWQSPTLGGFKLNTSFSLGEQAGNNGHNRLGSSLTYTNGPLSLAMAGEFNKAKLEAGEDKQTDWMLAGSYDFGVLRGFLQLARHQKYLQDIEYRTSQFGLALPLGFGQVLASWGHTRWESPQLQKTRDSTTAAYDYAFSKRTDAYAGAELDHLTGLSNGRGFFTGIRHRF